MVGFPTNGFIASVLRNANEGTCSAYPFLVLAPSPMSLAYAIPALAIIVLKLAFPFMVLLVRIHVVARSQHWSRLGCWLIVNLCKYCLEIWNLSGRCSAVRWRCLITLGLTRLLYARQDGLQVYCWRDRMLLNRWILMGLLIGGGKFRKNGLELVRRCWHCGWLLLWRLLSLVLSLLLSLHNAKQLRDVRRLRGSWLNLRILPCNIFSFTVLYAFLVSLIIAFGSG